MLIVVVAIELVDLGAGGVGVLNSAWGAGGLVGGFAALALLARGRFSTAMDAGAACVAVPLVVPLLVIARWSAAQRLDSEAVVPERELQALRAIDLFAPLPLATVETLALHALPRVVFADEQILRVGDIGTRFYVIADGTVEVQAGPIVARLGPGDYFGEIALLRDEPRMASVLAATDGLLYVVARPPFLQAVTGQARAAQAAETVIDARLRAANEVAYTGADAQQEGWTVTF